MLVFVTVLIMMQLLFHNPMGDLFFLFCKEKFNRNRLWQGQNQPPEFFTDTFTSI